MAAMTQRDVEKWIADHGGPSVFQYNPVDRRTIPNPQYDPITNPLVPQRLDVDVESWTNTKTGAKLAVRRLPDGTMDVFDSVGADPNKTPQAEAATPTQQEAARLRDERWWNQNTPRDPQNPRAGGSGLPESHVERYDREAREAKEAKPGAEKPAAPKGDTQPINGRVMEFNPVTGRYDIDHGPTTGPKEPKEPEKPDVRIESVDINGTRYTRQVVTPPGGGAPTIRNFGPDGKEIATLPSEPPKPQEKYTRYIQNDDKVWYGVTPDGRMEPLQGQEGAATPSGVKPITFPELVFGMSQPAIRGYVNQLNEEHAAGRMTSVQRALRVQEVFEAATIAMNEANILQHEDSTRINAQVNIATTRYTESMRGMEWAATLVQKINGTLPIGSTLGGKAFAALMGMQAQLLAQSGLANIVIPPARGQPGYTPHAAIQIPNAGPAPRLTDPTNPQAVQADLDAVLASPELAPKPKLPPPIFTPQPPAEYPGPSADAAPPPPAPVIPAAPVTPSAAPPAVAPVAPSAAPVVPFTVGAPLPGVERGAAAPGPPAPALPATAPAPVAPVMQPPMPTPDPAQDGGIYNPAQAAPHQNGVGMMPSQDEYPVLAQYAAPQLPMTTPAPITMPDQTMPPAVLQSMAASKPPWSMSNDEIQQYLAAGVPREVVFGVPGRTGVMA